VQDVGVADELVAQGIDDRLTGVPAQERIEPLVRAVRKSPARAPPMSCVKLIPRWREPTATKLNRP
jgi:hypothetical protein